MQSIEVLISSLGERTGKGSTSLSLSNDDVQRATAMHSPHPDLSQMNHIASFSLSLSFLHVSDARVFVNSLIRPLFFERKRRLGIYGLFVN